MPQAIAKVCSMRTSPPPRSVFAPIPIEHWAWRSPLVVGATIRPVFHHLAITPTTSCSWSNLESPSEFREETSQWTTQLPGILCRPFPGRRLRTATTSRTGDAVCPRSLRAQHDRLVPPRRIIRPPTKTFFPPINPNIKPRLNRGQNSRELPRLTHLPVPKNAGMLASPPHAW